MLIHYNPKLKQLARNLRNNSSISEIRFWNQVKGKQMKGYQFLRQKPIGNYIVDFFCSKLHLVIEIDGESHLGQEKADMKKQPKKGAKPDSILICSIVSRTDKQLGFPQSQ